MIRKLVLSSVIAMIPAIAFAADTASTAPATQPAVSAKTDTTAKTDVIHADASKPATTVASKTHKAGHHHKAKAKAKAAPMPDTTKS